jgi:hypothetical protein
MSARRTGPARVSLSLEVDALSRHSCGKDRLAVPLKVGQGRAPPSERHHDGLSRSTNLWAFAVRPTHIGRSQAQASGASSRADTDRPLHRKNGVEYQEKSIGGDDPVEVQRPTHVLMVNYQRSQGDGGAKNMAQQALAHHAGLLERRDDTVGRALPILIDPPCVQPVHRKALFRNHRKNAYRCARLNGLVDQQMGCHILDAPARAEGRRFPLRWCEASEEREKILPLLMHKLPVMNGTVVHLCVRRGELTTYYFSNAA